MKFIFRKSAPLIFLSAFIFSDIVATDFKKGTMEIGGNINSAFSAYPSGDNRFNIGLSPTFGYYFTDFFYIEGTLATSYNAESNGLSSLFVGLGIASGIYFNMAEKLTFAIPVGLSIARPFELTSSPNVVAYFNTQYYFFIRPTLKFKISDHVILGNALSFGSYYGNYYGDRLTYDRFNISYLLSWSYIW